MFKGSFFLALYWGGSLIDPIKGISAAMTSRATSSRGRNGIYNGDEEEHGIVKAPPACILIFTIYRERPMKRNVAEYVHSNRKDREKRNTFAAL